MVQQVRLGISDAFCLSRLHLNSLSNDASIAKGAELAKKHNIKAKAYKVEITKIDEIQATIDEVVSDFGKIDVFIANAGAAISKPLLETSIEEYKHQMAVNGELDVLRASHEPSKSLNPFLVDGVVYSAMVVGKVFQKQGFGNFIITSSMSAHIVNVSSSSIL